MSEIKTRVEKLTEGQTYTAKAEEYLVTEKHTIADIVRFAASFADMEEVWFIAQQEKEASDKPDKQELADKLLDVWNNHCSEDAAGGDLMSDLNDGWYLWDAIEALNASPVSQALAEKDARIEQLEARLGDLGLRELYPEQNNTA